MCSARSLVGFGILFMLFQGSSAAPQLTREAYCNNSVIGYNIDAVVEQARNLSSHSWEYGTAAEALLELYNSELSVFGDNPFPENQIPVVDWTSVEALAYVQPFISTDSQTFIDGDGAVGDPASLGVSAIIIGKTDQAYLDAASREADYILNTAPRYWNGAISQRNDTPDLWADFVFMAPPFLAYYAIETQNEILLKDTITQCGLYRQILQANISSTGDQGAFAGVWEHIIGPSDTQPELWSTGNAWAAAGMTRVLATTIKWGPSSSWSAEQAELKQWIKEIINGAMLSKAISIEPSSGLLRNNLNDTTWFGETSGTSLLASVVYRMAVLDPSSFGSSSGNGYIEWAGELREAVVAHVNASGILSPAIDPEDWTANLPYTTGSPEGESFAVLLAAAYRDWLCS